MPWDFISDLLLLLIWTGALCLVCLLACVFEKVAQWLRGSRRPSFFPVRLK